MSFRSTKPKPSQFGSDSRRLFQRAEDGQKADIQASSSGHLGPRSLVQSQPHKETKQPFWSMSEKHRETPKHLTPLKRQTVKKKNMKDFLAEVTTDFASLTTDQALATGHSKDFSFDAFPREDACLDISLPCMRKSLPKIQNATIKPKNTSSQRNKRYGCDQTKKLHELIKNDIWSCSKAAEVHESKLETELQKLSSQRWPCRDRLSVFSDVFGDVCESSPVFGHILREIKIDYDLFVLHLMSSLKNTPLQHPSKRPGTSPTGELEDKGGEVRFLERKAREAREENERLKAELQNALQTKSPEEKQIKDVLLSETGSEDADGRDTRLLCKRREVLDVWTEIQQLEEEIRDKLVSPDTTAAFDKRVRALKTETLKLLVSSNKLESTNLDLEDQINTFLSREKISKALHQKLWDEIKPRRVRPGHDMGGSTHQ